MFSLHLLYYFVHFILCSLYPVWVQIPSGFDSFFKWSLFCQDQLFPEKYDGKEIFLWTFSYPIHAEHMYTPRSTQRSEYLGWKGSKQARWSHSLKNFCFWWSYIFTGFFSGSQLAVVTDCPLHSLPFIDLYLWIFVSSLFGLTLCHSVVWYKATWFP